MNKYFIGMTPASTSVAIFFRDVSCPDPAWCSVEANRLIDGNIAEYTLKPFSVDVKYGKVFNSRQAKPLFAFGRAVQIVYSNLAARSIVAREVI